MHRVKYALVALALFSFTTTIVNASPNQPYKTKDGESFTGVTPSSIDKDSILEHEREDNKADNILEEYGPLTICSNKATYDSNKGRLTYFGDVFVMQIHNKHILCKKTTEAKQNTVYFKRNKKYTFKQLQKKWFEKAKKICADEKECNFISGQKLVMQLDEDKKVQTLIMSTKDDEIAQFYTYPTKANKDFKKSKKLTKGPLNGEGKKIVYDIVNKSFELYKKAIVTQNDNEYKGHKIVYDLKHDLISIPGSKNRRSTVVLDGVQEETKINAGLTPIANFNKDSTESSGSTIATPDSNLVK